MNRMLLVINALLALVLAVRLAQEGVPAHAAGEAEAPSPERWRVEVGSPPVQAIRIDFGAPVVGGASTEPVDPGLQLDPPVPLLAFWEDPGRLRLEPASPLAPATRYRLHFTRPLRAEAGWQVPAGTTLEVRTPSVRVTDVLVAEHDSRQTLRLGFDLPVAPQELAKHCRLVDADGGGEVLFEPEAIPGEEGRAFSLRPVAGDFPPRLRLTIAAELRPRGGELPMGRPYSELVHLRWPLHVTGVQASATAIDIGFNNAIPLPEPGMVRLEPPVEFQVQTTYRGLRLYGGFVPGQVYAVLLSGGLPGRGKRRLAAPLRRSVVVPDLGPELDFAQAGDVLSAKAEPVLRLRGVNVDEITVELRRLYPNNAVRLLQERWRPEPSLAPPVRHEIVPEIARNERFEVVVDLRTVLGEDPRGLYRVQVRGRAERRHLAATRFVQVTDLGTSVRAVGDSLAVQVVGIAGGEPVAGAAITVRTPTNQVLVEGRTDDAGLAVLRYARTGSDREPYLVQVEHQGDAVLVGLQAHGVELADEAFGGRPYAGGPEAWVGTSRGIARPGERMSATVLVRDGTGRAVAGLPVDLEWQAPNGRTWHRQRQSTPGSGLLAAHLQLGRDAPAGRWTLRVSEAETRTRLGRAAFLVEAFVPQRLEVEASLPEPLRFGRPAVVRVTGRWLDGSPAAGAPVTVYPRLDRGRFAPASLPGWSFASRSEQPPPGELPQVQGVLGPDGTAMLRVAMPEDAPLQVLQAVFRVEVADPSGRSVAAAVDGPVLRGDYHLGIRAGAGRWSLRTADADGRPVPCQEPVTVQLERRSWTWEREDRGRQRWRWRQRMVRHVLWQRELQLEGGAAEVDVEVPPPRDGWLVAVARIGAREVEQALGDVPATADRLRVRPLQATAAAGETARLAVETPVAGRGFVSLEGREVLWVGAVALRRGHNEVAVPIPAGLALPNVHAVVTLTRGVAGDPRGEQGPHWLVAGTSVALERTELATPVALTAPERIAPGGELRLRLRAPGATAATVAVVDEGVLQITGSGDPDPLAFFLARRRLSGQGADTGGHLLQEMTFAKGVRTGGDRDEDLSLALASGTSNRIRPLALFDRITLDPSGHGELRLSLPDYEGRVRVMAVAAGAEVLGASSRSVTVRGELGVQVALPRVAAPGDRFAAAVTVKNHRQAGAVRLVLQAGGGLALEGEGERELELDAGATADLSVWLRAGESAPVPASLTVAAELGDARRESRAEMELRAPVVAARDFVGLRLEGEQEIAIPDDWVRDGLTATLRVDTAPDLQLRPALEALLRYPYGCLEQTTSKAMGLLACSALLPRMYGAEQPPPVAPLLQAAVDRIFSMQVQDGGFGLWPGASSSHAFGSVHALDFLLAARARGAAMPDSALGDAIDWLQRQVARSEDRDLRYHAIEVLARAGRPVQPYLQHLTVEAAGAEPRALVALAWSRLGRITEARALLAHGEGEPDLRRQTGGLLRSPLRARALAFRARLAAAPQDIGLPAEAAFLTRAVARPRATTTQEQAQVLRALAEYYAGAPPAADAVVEVRAGGQRRELRGAGAAAFAVAPGQKIALRAEPSAFGLLEVRGLRKVAAGGALPEGMRLRRRYFDEATGEEVRAFRRGRVYAVRIEGFAAEPADNLLVTDLLPGGLEPELPSALARPVDPPDLTPAHIDRRDDRVLLFARQAVQGYFLFVHRVRATLPGTYLDPGLQVEALYDPELQWRSGAGGTIEVLP